MLKVIDTHAHLDHVENVDEALKSAFKVGVAAVIAVGIDKESNQKNLEIKKRTAQPKVFVALGIHPESLADAGAGRDRPLLEDDFNFIRDHIKDAIAVGEIGLDYWYTWAKKDEQKKCFQREVFERQLKMAKEYTLPAIIHSRGSWRDCLDMAKKSEIKKAVFHWYSGPADILKEILECGYCVSASPALSYSPQHRDAIANAPIEQTLIETDSPVFYSAYDGADGEGEHGFRAAPQDVLKTLKLYCDLKHIEIETAAEILFKNSVNFFNLKL